MFCDQWNQIARKKTNVCQRKCHWYFSGSISSYFAFFGEIDAVWLSLGSATMLCRLVPKKKEYHSSELNFFLNTCQNIWCFVQTYPTNRKTIEWKLTEITKKNGQCSNYKVWIQAQKYNFVHIRINCIICFEVIVFWHAHTCIYVRPLFVLVCLCIKTLW